MNTIDHLVNVQHQLNTLTRDTHEHLNNQDAAISAILNAARHHTDVLEQHRSNTAPAYKDVMHALGELSDRQQTLINSLHSLHQELKRPHVHVQPVRA